MKKISIVIAAYNAQSWLEECLNSIFIQVLPDNWDMEILVGVDGCDKTLQSIQAMTYPALQLFYMKNNSGTYLTFNTLMRYAAGELICRFDADDVMKPNFLYSQIQALEQGVDMTMSWSIFTDAALQPTSYVMAHEMYHPENGLNRRGSDGQFIMKRHVWQHLGGFRAWRCGADTDFFQRLRISGFTHTVIPEFLFYRRTHAQSLTVHPDTNFKSPLRLSIQKRCANYKKQYQTGNRKVKIRAEYVKDHVRL